MHEIDAVAGFGKGWFAVDLKGVDLNLLVALDALLSERNVTRAAKRLSLGQPAMSAALGRLRRYFDDPLLVREGKVLVLTPTAVSLGPLVRDAVAANEAVFGQHRGFDSKADRQRFTIMASDYVTLVLLRPLVARLAREAPSQRVNVVPVKADHAEQLRMGQTDLLVLPAELAGFGFAFPQRYLFNDRYVLIADADNHNVRSAVTAEEFARLPYVAYSGGPLSSLAEAQLEALGISPSVKASTQSFVTMPHLVIGTPFVSLVPERLARLVAAWARLKVLEPPVPLRPVSEALFWHPRHTADRAHSSLRDRIADHAAELDHQRY
ncbi:LysR family transcriptional regulator [Streptomyces silvisoli]|uniref:LysR substrate-binding domain-containing protein n=1 Tax=Streptomyces silvisoli TaxID=3034235 RepID=A0ABT5ZGW4_9ACTN|nr:LysR family transcriptional regulator [Streptomyces silvisoli]MDF3289068.1 LysR substrate-binding domain-containing protein [Streptomyces silvisoli]